MENNESKYFENLKNLINEWKKDARVDKTKVDDELANVDNLHAKYAEQHYMYLTLKDNKLKKMNKLKSAKTKWYKGKMTKEELEKLGWEQFQGINKTEASIERALEDDEDMQAAVFEISIIDRIANFCLSVVKQLNGRQFALRGIVDYQKQMNGFV